MNELWIIKASEEKPVIEDQLKQVVSVVFLE